MASEKRLIDANALLDKIQYRLPVVGTIAEVLSDVVGMTRRHIEEASTVDAVEVVRCNECRWYLPECECCQFWHGRRRQDHFCSEGERRTDNGRSDVSGGDPKSTGA